STTGQTTEQPLSDKAWNDATHFLSAFGLITIQADDDNLERLLDCHPLIREHFRARLKDKIFESWRLAHIRLYEHLGNTAPHQPDTVEDMQLLYDALRHACQAGQFREARRAILRPRIQR